jgi:hypothetical protein
MSSFDASTFRVYLAAFVEREQLTVRDAARAVGCPEASLLRILDGKTFPAEELLKQSAVMFEIGFARYTKLTAAEKESISEKIGTASAGAFGFATITAAVSALGVPGLSAAGISSGLAVLGSVVGGGMIVGVSVAAAIPIAAGAAGYAVIKGIKYLISESQLNSTEIDPRWETVIPPALPGNGEDKQ